MTTQATPALPATGYLRQAHLVGSKRRNDIVPILPFSATTLWRMVANKAFPQPVKLSTKVTAWRVEDVRAWMDARA